MSKKNALFPLVKENIAFENLWQQVTDLINPLSSMVWSDTGEHDPGITLLQAVTWNCSDLSYRASHSANDLLTRADETLLFPEAFGPHKVLTCNTVTAEDYRRALLDLHSEVIKDLTTDEAGFLFSEVRLVQEPESERFHWWYNRDTREYSFSAPEGAGDEDDDVWRKLTLRGNYWLSLIPSRFTQRLTAADRQLIDNYLNDFLASHRNLGEQVSHIEWLKPVEFNPQITLELEDDINDINQLVAQIYQAVNELLLPSTKRYSTEALRELGVSNEEIFVGPLLNHGWQLPSTSVISDDGIKINLSSLVKQLLAIPGVASISKLSADAASSAMRAESGEEGIWQFKQGKYPLLWGDDPAVLLSSADSPLKLLAKGGIYLSADAQHVSHWLNNTGLIHTTPVVLPAGKRRNLSAYTPVGNRLPECYQMQQPNEVINDTVRELHQFLLPVDQQLADGVDELCCVPELLAFTRRAEVIRGTQWPYAETSVNQSVHQGYTNALIHYQQQDVAVFPAGDKTYTNFYRELDFLNYLLSYFGTSRASRPLTFDLPDFLATQRAYLAQQPSLGYDRINIRIDQVSALQKRIAARIGLNSECFADEPDLGNLPFYLIEHRQLLPPRPNTAFDNEQTVDSCEFRDIDSGTQITLTSKGSAGKIIKGQLIDLIVITDTGTIKVSRQLVVSTNGDSFLLETANSQLLQNHINDIKTAVAQSKDNLHWQNSNIWLQDMVYQLNYAEETLQADDENQCLLVSSERTPFPAMVKVGDKINIHWTNLSLTGPNGAMKKPVKRDETLSIDAVIKKINVIGGTLKIEKASDAPAFPAREEAWHYEWNFTEAAYVTDDRFSFVVSIVHNRSLIEKENIDTARLVNWLQQTVMAEFPAHVSLINHWLSDSAFEDFALTYKRWQNNKLRLSDDAFSIIQKLSLGLFPVAALGIGLMRIATQAQHDAAVGKEGTDWNPDVIIENELFYVPTTE